MRGRNRKDEDMGQTKKAERNEGDRPLGGEDVSIEAGAILEYLEAGERVLNVGCRDGLLAVECAVKKDIRILGLDGDPAMIEAARARRVRSRLRLTGEVKFEQGDVAALAYCREIFDKVVAVEAQATLNEPGRLEKAQAEWSRVLKPGGLLLVCGDSAPGRENLNRFRAQWGLDPLPAPAKPSPLDPEANTEESWPDLELVESRDYSSTYDVLTRVLKPLLAASPAASALDVSAHGEFERFAAGLPSWGEYGMRRLFVFRRLPQEAQKT